MTTVINGEEKFDLLTVEEAAQKLRIGRTKMFSLISAGAIKSISIGRSRRIPPECLAEYIATEISAIHSDNAKA